MIQTISRKGNILMKPNKKTLFKLYHIENKTIKEIAKIFNLERHTVSRLLKKNNIEIKRYRSKIKSISKEELISLYDNQNKTVKEICKIYSVGKKAINKWLKEYNIKKITGPQRRYHLARKIPFTKDQVSIIIGTLLGDASLSSSGNFKRLSVSHCEKQLDYLLWKKKMLSNFVTRMVKNEEWKWGSVMYSINTMGHQDFDKIYNILYRNDKKVITYNLINHLDNLALAVWFMDDGSSKKNKNGVTYCSKISTEGFSYKENVILQNILNTNFNIRSKICKYSKDNKKYNYISIDKENSVKLSKIIEKYTVDCMKYKLVYG